MKKIIAFSLLSVMALMTLGSSAFAMNPFEKHQIQEHKKIERIKRAEFHKRHLSHHNALERKKAMEMAHHHNRPWH